MTISYVTAAAKWEPAWINEFGLSTAGRAAAIKIAVDHGNMGRPHETMTLTGPDYFDEFETCRPCAAIAVQEGDRKLHIVWYL